MRCWTATISSRTSRFGSWSGATSPTGCCRCGTRTCSAARLCWPGSTPPPPIRGPGSWRCSPSSSAWALVFAAVYDLALAGMYLFLRREGLCRAAAAFGAATFAFAGYMTAQIVHVDLIQGAAALPWMLLAVHVLTGRADEHGPVRRRRVPRAMSGPDRSGAGRGGSGGRRPRSLRPERGGRGGHRRRRHRAHLLGRSAGGARLPPPARRCGPWSPRRRASCSAWPVGWRSGPPSGSPVAPSSPSRNGAGPPTPSSPAGRSPTAS